MKVKGWLLGILSTALIFVVTYMFWATVDEKLKARYPETVEDTEVTVEDSVDVERNIEFETTEIETETSEITQKLNATSEDIQPIIVTEPVVYEPVEDSDLMLLAKLIQNEAGADYCSDEHQRAVASVLMNHVASPYFPNTIEGCIFVGWTDNGIKNYGIGSVADFMALIPSERAIANAQYVMTYGSTVGDAIYQAEFIPEGGEIVAVFDYGIGLPTYICR